MYNRIKRTKRYFKIQQKARITKVVIFNYSLEMDIVMMKIILLNVTMMEEIVVLTLYINIAKHVNALIQDIALPQ